MTIDERGAKEVAKKFLEQYHSIIVTKAILDQDVWNVTAREISRGVVRNVKVDATTGRILDYT